MEDAHIVAPDIEEGISIFGVFDGHGGKEVALFVEKYFVIEIKKNQNFKDRKMELALKETFLKMDEMLGTSEGKKDL